MHDPKVDRAVGAKACCDVVNRGVAVYGGKVFVGVIDGRLVALDAATGSVAWETVTVDQSQAYTITGAPRAANGLVYIGNGGAEYGVRGYVSAYDANTGSLRWRFYTVPGDPAKGPDGAASDPVMARAAETWTGEWWAGGGGGTAWDAIVYDPELDQLLVGVGNGSPWNQQVRSPGGGDNLFLASIVALDAKTGAYQWHYQTTPGETWDYTATQPIMLADLTIEGRPRKVAMQAPKNGFFYVIDRTDGRLISASPFLEMLPANETPKGAPLAWAYAVDRATGRPIENPEARYKSGAVLIHPSPDGGHNWHPMSYSPQTGLVYLPMQDMALDYAHDPAFTRREGFNNIGALFGLFPDDPQVRRAIRNSVKAALLAWDPVTQKEVWRAARPGPWNGGTLAVAGGLVFQGTVDGRFLALDAKTGAELWSYDNQAATLAGPISYEVDGEQYVAVPAGYGTVILPHQRLLRAEGGRARERAGLRVQARGRGAETADRLCPHPDAATAGAARDRERVSTRRADVRGLLPHLSRHRRDHWRRASRPAEVGPAARRRPVEAGRRRRRPRGAGDAPVRALHYGRGCGTDPGLRRTAGGDVVRGGAGRRSQGVKRCL